MSDEPPKIKFKKGIFKFGKDVVIANGKGEHIVIDTNEIKEEGEWVRELSMIMWMEMEFYLR